MTWLNQDVGDTVTLYAHNQGESRSVLPFIYHTFTCTNWNIGSGIQFFNRLLVWFKRKCTFSMHLFCWNYQLLWLPRSCQYFCHYSGLLPVDYDKIYTLWGLVHLGKVCEYWDLFHYYCFSIWHILWVQNHLIFLKVCHPAILRYT